LTAFLDQNKEKYSDLEGSVALKANSFTPSDFDNSGSYTIVANATGKYTGEVVVTISQMAKLELSGLEGLNKEVASDTTEGNALSAFLNQNQENYSDLEGNVVLKVNSFTPSDFDNSGFYTIVANETGKYTGEVVVTISPMAKLELSGLEDLNKEVASDTTEETALATFLDQNKEKYSDLEGNVVLKANSFTPSDFDNSGSYTIVANETGKYTGEVNVTITQMAKLELSGLEGLNKEVASDTTEETALAAFLDQNKENYSDLEGNVALKDGTFVASAPGNSGSYTIVANETGKYTGEVNVTISAPAPKDANEAVDIINQLIHQDIPIDGPGQTVLFTAEE